MRENRNGMWNFVDEHAMMILLCMAGIPKTRTEISKELRDIPIASVYKKISKLERFGIIRKVESSSPDKTNRKRQNDLYKIASKNFVMRINQDKSIFMTI